MQIAITMKHAGLSPAWGCPVYVRALDLHCVRPVIYTSAAPCETDAEPGALDVILSEIIGQRGAAFCGYRIETSDRFAIVSGD